MKFLHGWLLSKPLTTFKCLLLFTRSSSTSKTTHSPHYYLQNPTTITLTHFLKTHQNPSHINQILAQLIIQNHPFHHFSLMKLIDYCVFSNGFTFASLIFSYFHVFFDSFICNSIIKTYTHLHKHWHSIFIFVQMHKHGFSPDFLTFPAVIKSTARLRRRRLGKSLHCCVIKMGFFSDLFANTSLVHMYSCSSSVDDARKVFDEMSERNSVCWNALITGYVNGRRYLEALDVFRGMMSVGAKFGEVTMVELLSTCANLGALEQGKWVHDYIRRNRLAVNVYVGTALIDMYAKCGCLDEGVKVFEAMKVKNVCTWNVLISGYAMNGLAGDALTVFYRMVFEDYKPDDVTFLAVSSACYDEGLVVEGLSHFKSMEEEFGVEPKVEHYCCMVDLLSRADLMFDALEVVKITPLKLYPTIWRALLRAFQVRKNTQLTEVLILKLIELEPQNGDNFFLLSNLYIQQQRWTELEVVRKMIQDRNIQKIPGYSSIVINNEIHEFVASYYTETGFEELFELLAYIYKDFILSSYDIDSEIL